MEITFEDNAIVLDGKKIALTDGYNPIFSSERIELIIATLEAYKAHLLKCLKARRDACAALLKAHADNLTFVSEFQLVWQRKDGTYGYFNRPGWECINRAISLISMEEWEQFLNDIGAVDQTIKALMWPEHPEVPTEIGKARYSGLISLLTEVHLVRGEVSL